MSLEAIESLVRQKIGMEAKIIGSRKISRAVEKRRYIRGIADLDAYLQVLLASPQEFAELVELLVVPETWFFRDRHPFEFLINYARSQWLPSSGSAKLRLLSVPCSTGEEPYSISIALMEAGIPPQRFTVDAIDISSRAIAIAERAVYGKNSFRGEAFVDRRRYFHAQPTGYEVSTAVRQTVKFSQGNLLNASSFLKTKYDIIFCRNLLIYLGESASTKALDILERLLHPLGLLFVGAAETAKIQSNNLKSIRQPYTFAYQKRASVVATPPQSAILRYTGQIKPDFKQSQSKPLSEPVVNNTQSPTRLKVPTSLQTKTYITQAAPNFSLEIARKFADVGEIEAAMEECQKYLRSDRASDTAHSLMGTLYQVKNENDQAEIYFRKALYLNPDCYEALINLALLKEQRGDLIGAKIMQERIQKLQQKSSK